MQPDQFARRDDAKRVVGAFSKDLVDLFGAPKPPSGSLLSEADYAKRWGADMLEDLWPYSAETLERARKILRQTSKYKSMPSNAEILAAAKEAYKQIESEKPRLIRAKHELPDSDPWSEARQDTADMLLKTAMGRRAVGDGCILTLWNYCRERGRLPTEGEYQQMIQGADLTLKLINDLVGKTDSVSEACLRWGNTLIERRQQMADFVYGKGEAVWRT